MPEKKYTLEEARKIIASQAGNASFDARGVAGMRQMARKSWEKPSPKREAFAIILKALSPYKVARVRELNIAGIAECDTCSKPMAPVKRENIVPSDWNRPYETKTLCSKCLKRHAMVPMTSDTVERIMVAKKLSNDPKIIVKKALGYSTP